MLAFLASLLTCVIWLIWHPRTNLCNLVTIVNSSILYCNSKARPFCECPMPVACYKMDALFFFLFSLSFSFPLTFTLTRTIRYDSVVRRPYGGLTFLLSFSYHLLTFTSVDCLVATAEHCLAHLGLGLDLHTASFIFSYCTAPSIVSTFWTDPLHAMRRGDSTPLHFSCARTVHLSLD